MSSLDSEEREVPGADDATLPPDEGASRSILETRREFLIALARTTPFVPPALLTLDARPAAAQGNRPPRNQALSNFFAGMSVQAAQNGQVVASNVFQGLSNFFAFQQTAQGGGLSPRGRGRRPVIDPRLTPGGPVLPPWHHRGGDPPPWAVPPPRDPRP